MDLDFILIGSIIAFIAGWIGWHARGIMVIFNISRNPDYMIEVLKEIKRINAEEGEAKAEQAGTVTELDLHKQGDVVYAFDAKTGQFLAQGQSLAEAITDATRRFPGKKFWHPDLDKDSRTT